MKMRGILMRNTGKERGLLLLRTNDIAVYQKNDMVENFEVRSVTRRKLGEHGKKLRIYWTQKSVNTELFFYEQITEFCTVGCGICIVNHNIGMGVLRKRLDSPAASHIFKHRKWISMRQDSCRLKMSQG